MKIKSPPCSPSTARLSPWRNGLLPGVEDREKGVPDGGCAWLQPGGPAGRGASPDGKQRGKGLAGSKCPCPPRSLLLYFHTCLCFNKASRRASQASRPHPYVTQRHPEHEPPFPSVTRHPAHVHISPLVPTCLHEECVFHARGAGVSGCLLLFLQGQNFLPLSFLPPSTHLSLFLTGVGS